MKTGWLVKSTALAQIKRGNTDIFNKRKLLEEKRGKLGLGNIKTSVAKYTGLIGLEQDEKVLFGRFDGSGETLKLTHYTVITFDGRGLWKPAGDGKRWLINIPDDYKGWTENIKGEN